MLYDMIIHTCFSLQISKDSYLAIRDNYENSWTNSFKKADKFRIDLIIIDEIDRLKFPTLYIQRHHTTSENYCLICIRRQQMAKYNSL